MSLETVLLIIIGAIVVGGALVIVRNQVRPKRRDRRYLRDIEGNMISTGGAKMSATLELSGDALHTSPPAQLPAAKHVISYEFHTPTRVALVAADGEEITLLISQGAGVKDFYVEQAGTYRWRVEPNAAGNPWRVSVYPVGRRR
jgi:hypothetical protein